jgi:hypothetical protein
MHRPVLMEPRTAWILFVLTMVIHSITFILLQSVADSFKRYMAPTTGVCRDKTPVVEKPDPRSEPNATTYVFDDGQGSRSRLMKGGVYYQELHQTLDVSVFR